MIQPLPLLTPRIILVACVARKLDTPATAQYLYTSPWFKKAREYAQSLGAPWFILSAQHGLLAPDAIVAPYEVTLNNKSKGERMDWAQGVVDHLLPHVTEHTEIVVLAGLAYRQFLIPRLVSQCPHVLNIQVPMRSLGIGKQLQWLDAQIQKSRKAS